MYAGARGSSIPCSSAEIAQAVVSHAVQEPTRTREGRLTCRVPEISDQPDNDHCECDKVEPVWGIVLRLEHPMSVRIDDRTMVCETYVEEQP
jgi:hypothetical protein